MVNRVVRVYNDGSRVVLDFHSEQEMDNHLHSSIHSRFGCAHFRNGKCISVGYLGIDRCCEIEKQLATAFDSSPSTTQPD